MNSLPMLNTQPTEGLDRREDGSLEIVSCFRTIQGEGPLAGSPAVFVRLAGCNLQCRMCDTDYTTSRKRLDVEEIIDRVRVVRGTDNVNLVVLTGGEPFRQNIVPLIDRLTGDIFDVQIETNGTLWLEEMERFGDVCEDGCVSLVCSPKTAKVNPKVVREQPTWKYVVEAGFTDAEDGLPTRVLGEDCKVFRPDLRTKRYGGVYVQPMDAQDPVVNKANVDEAVRVCMKFGYRLSLQTHKVIGLE